MNESELDYLKELYSKIREEFIFHLNQRDNWLKYQLIVQGSLFAIVNGIEIAYAKASVPKLEILGFSIIVSLLFGCLYFAEDNVIGYLLKYLGRLTRNVFNDSNNKGFENSPEMIEYTNKIRPFRDLTSFVIFLAIPVYLGTIRFIVVKNWKPIIIGEILLDSILTFILISLIIKTYRFRRKLNNN